VVGKFICWALQRSVGHYGRLGIKRVLKKKQLKALLKLCSQLVLSYNIGQGSIPKMCKQWTGSEDPEEEWTGGASSTDWSRASRIVEEDDTLGCR
jgi:hypothetical protein